MRNESNLVLRSPGAPGRRTEPPKSTRPAEFSISHTLFVLARTLFFTFLQKSPERAHFFQLFFSFPHFSPRHEIRIIRNEPNFIPSASSSRSTGHGPRETSNGIRDTNYTKQTQFSGRPNERKPSFNKGLRKGTSPRTLEKTNPISEPPPASWPGRASISQICSQK